MLNYYFWPGKIFVIIEFFNYVFPFPRSLTIVKIYFLFIFKIIFYIIDLSIFG